MSRAISLRALKGASRAALAKLHAASEGERRSTFAAMLRNAKLPDAVPELVFHPDRKWRFDYAWPALKVALEVEGGVWTEGRHTRGSGFLKDIEKYNAAAVLGWRVVRCTPDTLTTRATETMLRRLLSQSVSGGAR